MNPTRGETDPSRNPVPSEHHGGDGAATGGHDSPVLTPVEALVEQFYSPSVSLEDMLQVALDPSTPDPGDELIPDNDSVHDSASDAGADAGGASGEPDLSDLGMGLIPTPRRVPQMICLVQPVNLKRWAVSTGILISRIRRGMMITVFRGGPRIRRL